MYLHFKKKVVVVLILALIFGVFAPKSAYAQELNAARIEFIEKYADMAIRLGAIYDQPWETAMGIAIYESQAGTSYSAIKRHNFHGLIAGKEGVNQKFSSDEEGWEAFYKNILEQPCYSAHGALQYRDDPEKFLEAIANAGYNPDPKTYLAKVMPFVKAVEEYRDKKGWPSSQGCIKMLYQYDGLDEFHPTADYALYVVTHPETTVLVTDDEISSGAATIF